MDGSETAAKRWRKERLDRVVQEDIRDLEYIREIQSMLLLVELLKTRVGDPIVVSNLAQDIQVSPVTVKKWLEILEKMYVIFLVHPYTKNLSRAVQKPPKVYFFDNADVVGDEGAKFENLVATHLLKRNHFRVDSAGDRCQLN